MVIRERVEESSGVVSLILARPDGAPLPAWTPGAHIDVLVGDGTPRQYSLCGDPGESGRWRIAVLRAEQGRGGSVYLHERVAGDTLAVGAVRNHFPLVHARRFVLIAGGIGITPLLPMARELAAGVAPWTLHYGGRTRAAMAFAAEFADRECCTLYPEDEVGPLPLRTILDAVADSECAVYCCGPEGLIAAAERLCRDRPKLRLHVERFSPRPVEPETPSDTASYEVELRRSGRTLTVERGASLIDELRDAGVAVPFSCREGTCGSCETPVLAGAVTHRDSILTDAERLAGRSMMLCVSSGAADRLVLDL
nr:PDR/VanB family oxidoreductase [Nocardia arizonensis]